MVPELGGFADGSAGGDLSLTMLPLNDCKTLATSFLGILGLHPFIRHLVQIYNLRVSFLEEEIIL